MLRWLSARRIVTAITLRLLLALSGLIVGALGRLIVPGPNPMGLLETIVIGLGGSFLGGLIARLGFGWRFRYSLGFGFSHLRALRRGHRRTARTQPPLDPGLAERRAQSGALEPSATRIRPHRSTMGRALRARHV